MVTTAMAVEAGVNYLRSTVSDGRWQAFSLPDGRASDGWVTAYVAATLAEARVPGTADLVAEALEAVLAWQRPDGRFGWGEHTAADADSTIWSLRLATAVRTASTAAASTAAASTATANTAAANTAAPPGDPLPGRLADAARALAGHLRPDGGVACFLPTDQPIPWLMRSSVRHPFAGWCSANPCVTAAAAAPSIAVTAAPARQYLLATQRPDGSWPAYWWVDREYTVGHAAQALAASAPATLALSRAGAWALRRVGPDGAVRTPDFPDGSPFATAMVLRTLLAAGMSAATPADAAATWLCRSIGLNDAWRPSAMLRVPHPHAIDPDCHPRPAQGRRTDLFGAVVPDLSSAFTTATVVAALTGYHRSGRVR